MMKSFVITAVAAVMLVTSGTAAAEITKINVGPTLSPFLLRLLCVKEAGERNGRYVRSERDGSNEDSFCFIDLPKRSGGIVATPGTVNQVRPQSTQQGTIRQPIQPAQTQGSVNQTVQQIVPQVLPSTAKNVEMVNVGRLWSQAHAEDRCKAIAASKKTTWTGIWKKHDSRGEAQCQLRKKADYVLKPVSTDRIWSDGHAKHTCPRVAKENGGVWADSWKPDPKNKNKSICMVKMKIIPMAIKAFVTTKIWSNGHAKQHCTQLAKQNKGEWQGEWRNTQDNKSSICMIKVPEQLTKPVKQPVTQQPTSQSTAIWNQNLRNVKAGGIWDQAHAERKCPVVARNAKGSWTGRWEKTGPGNESVCQVKFGSGIIAQPTKPATTAKPVQEPAGNARTRNVAAGQIWDDKQAASKCPVVAANNKAKWTGNWTKTGPGHISVCEISVSGTSQPAQSQKPIEIKVNSGGKREVHVGGIWDQAQAAKKCSLAATNNKGTWTGKWRKISTTNAVCEIEF